MFIVKKLIFLVLATTLSFALTVKDKIYEGSVENYVIYEHNRSALALVIHRLESDRLTVEEIATSVNAKPSHLTWQVWLEQGAPGHTSWLIYDLDPTTGKLFDAYSFSKGCFVTLQDQAPMTAILLEAKLTPIPDALRKRVGAKPSAAAFTDRAIWQPPLFINGKKEKSPLDAFASSWPDDTSEFSKKDLTLYYGKNLPFPCWIEISREHKLRAIDMGKKLNMVPARSPKAQTTYNKGDTRRHFSCLFHRKPLTPQRPLPFCHRYDKLHP